MHTTGEEYTPPNHQICWPLEEQMGETLMVLLFILLHYFIVLQGITL